jgi:NADH-quinone oxidoreductase subunit L
MVFFGQPRHAATEHAQESPKVITIPLIILAALSILGGLLNFPGLHSLTNWLEHTIAGVEAGEFNVLLAASALLLALLAIFITWLIYGRKPLAVGQKDPLKKSLGFAFTGMENKWYVDEIYNAIILKPYMATAAFLSDVIDGRFWHDWFHEKVVAGLYQWISQTVLSLRVDSQGIDAFFDGLAELTRRISASLRRLQNGFVRTYALAVLFGVVLIVGYLLLK